MSIFMFKNEKIGIVDNPNDIVLGDHDISNIGDGTLTGAVKAINEKTVKSEEGANGLRYYNNDLAVKNSFGEWDIITADGPIGVKLKAPTNISVTSGDEEVTIKWTDPDDIIVDGVALASWDNTVIVRKEMSAPINETDGEVVLESKVRNQYSTVGFKDTGLTNGVTYYYGIFPGTKGRVYTASSTSGVIPKISYPAAATNIAVSEDKDTMSATVTFTLPANTTATVVMKAGGVPSSSKDGIIKSGLSKGTVTFTGLAYDTTYYFKVYTYNAKNRETSATTSVSCFIKSLNIVTWADGSWEDISAMLNAHYAGEINIASYWSIGDTKRVYLNTVNGTTGTMATQSAQYIDLTIIGTGHDTLVTTINGKTKAAITLHSKFCLRTNDLMSGSGHSLWSECPRRTWCNDNFKNALPEGLIPLIKKVTKKTYRGCDSGYSDYGTYRGTVTTEDDVFLLSEMEVFGTQYLSDDKGSGLDGSQYTYYNTASNRVKYIGIDGTITNIWWLRSSYIGSSFSNKYFYCTYSDGTAYAYSPEKKYGIVPAFCI